MAGTDLEFTVTFDENVTVTGTPRISLVIGGTTVYADYAEGSGSAMLKFVYAVNAGQTDTDGITVGTLTLNGGAIGDHAGNPAILALNSVGSTANVLVDTVAPVSGGGGTVIVGTVTSSSAALSWGAAADTSTTAAALQYKVVYSHSDNIATVTNAEGNGTVAKSWTANITSATVTGLSASTTYYFNVLVRDEAGNISAYIPVSKMIGASDHDDDDDDDDDPKPTTPVQPSAPPPAPPVDDSGVEIMVNGEAQSGSATATTITEDGHTTTVVVLDSERLSQLLEHEGDGATVTVPVNTGSDVVVGELNGQMVREMETREGRDHCPSARSPVWRRYRSVCGHPARRSILRLYAHRLRAQDYERIPW